VELDAPAVAGTTALTLPATSGTVALTASPTLSDPTFTGNLVWSGATLRAATAEVLTSQTTASTSYTDLATVGPSVTLTTGTKALVITKVGANPLGQGVATIVSFAVSGATTISAADKYGSDQYIVAVSSITQTAVYLITGLTAGSNTFTVKYKTSGGSGGAFGSRVITVIDMGS
jgi:hypothetical protein